MRSDWHLHIPSIVGLSMENVTISCLATSAYRVQGDILNRRRRRIAAGFTGTTSKEHPFLGHKPKLKRRLYG
jgi:hypothetical protein